MWSVGLVRALPSDLERWQMDKWTWEEALDIYMTIEDFDGPNSSYHSTQGFLRTSPPAVETALSNEFIEACEELGIHGQRTSMHPVGGMGLGTTTSTPATVCARVPPRRFLGRCWTPRRASPPEQFPPDARHDRNGECTRCIFPTNVASTYSDLFNIVVMTSENPDQR